MGKRIPNGIQWQAAGPVRLGLGGSAGLPIEPRNRCEPDWFGYDYGRGCPHELGPHYVNGRCPQKSDERGAAVKGPGKVKTTKPRRKRKRVGMRKFSETNAAWISILYRKSLAGSTRQARRLGGLLAEPQEDLKQEKEGGRSQNNGRGGCNVQVEAQIHADSPAQGANDGREKEKALKSIGQVTGDHWRDDHSRGDQCDAKNLRRGEHGDGEQGDKQEIDFAGGNAVG